MANFQLISKNGKTVYNGKSMKIHTALRNIYETHNVNSATIDGRLVRFNNVAYCYVDSLPESHKEKILAQYDKDAERMFYNGNVITV